MFEDRSEAGRVLAGRLVDYAGRADVVVLALPRGVMPVAFEIASSLGAPLDVWSVRKLGVPGHQELAMGAIAANGTRVVNQPVVELHGGTLAALGVNVARLHGRTVAELWSYTTDQHAVDEFWSRPAEPSRIP